MAKKLNHHMYQDKVSGVWYFQKKVKGRPGPYKFTLETTSVVEARRRRDRLLNEIAIYGDIRKPETPPDEIEQVFFGKVAQQWAAIKKTQVSRSTFREYRKTLNKHVLPVFGNRPISLINSLEIESFQSKLKCSGKTIRNIMTPFKNIMKFAKKHKIISYNPMDDVDGVRVSGKAEIHPLSLDEIKAFLEAVPIFYRPLFVFLFFTGARFGEAAALKWKRVDFATGVVKIWSTLVMGEIKEPKTKSSIRNIKLSSLVVEALREQRKHTMGKSEFVFLNQLGRNIHPHSINAHVFKPTLRKIGLSAKRSCKDTRASFITNSLDAKERMGFVQKQVGHTTTKMIVNHYYNYIPSKDDGQKLEEAWNSTRNLPESDEANSEVIEKITK